MSIFTPGEWYIFVTCDNCKTKQSLFQDLTRGQSRYKGTYVWTCPECSHKGNYDSEKLEHYQFPSGTHPPE